MIIINPIKIKKQGMIITTTVNKINKKRKFIILAFGLLFIAASSFFYIQGRLSETTRIDSYFIDNTGAMLEYEVRRVQTSSDNKTVLREAVSNLFDGPRNKSLLRFDLKKLDVKDIDLRDRSAVVNFSDDYYDLDPETELLFRAALVWTLTSLDFVDNIKIMVDGCELENLMGSNHTLLDRNNVVLNPKILDEKLNIQELKLYFIKDNYLVPENRVMNISPNHPIEKYVLEQLICGPNDPELQKTVNEDTKIYEVKTDKNICYVSLSDNFVNRSNSYDNLELTVYSVVNSLTELQDINKVQFLVESDKLDQKDLSFDFTKPFERNQKIIGGVKK